MSVCVCELLLIPSSSSLIRLLSLFQDEEDFMFEKGDLNLWAEPVQWVRLLHQHLCCLVETWSRGRGGVGPELEQQLRGLSAQARARVLACQQGLEALPVLPQFSCPGQHQRLLLGHHRASLALDVLDRLRDSS